MTLTPAYGRDYNSQKAVKEDFAAGKDFIVNDITSRWDGKPCNRADLLTAGVKNVQIRYARNTKVMAVKVSA